MYKLFFILIICLNLTACLTGKDPNIELISTGFNTTTAWDQYGNPIFSNHRSACFKNKTTGVIHCTGN